MQNTRKVADAPLLRNAPIPRTASKRADTVDAGILQEGRYVVTPKIAQQIIDRFNYATQRPISRHHVERLAGQMAAGVWTPGSQIAFGVLPDKRAFLVNGQHRMAAVVASGQDVEFQVLLLPAADEQELHALYYRFDAVQRTRTTGNILQSIGIAAQLGITKRLAAGVYSAGVLIALGFRNVQYSHRPAEYSTPDGKLRLAEEWWEYAKVFDGILADTRNPRVRVKLMSAGCTAVALVTLRHQSEKAGRFWRDVATNDGLRVGNPAKTLAETLIERSFRGDEGAHMTACSLAWNAFFRGDKRNSLRVASAAQIRILGTPYAKG